jgi:hypothetical protein
MPRHHGSSGLAQPETRRAFLSHGIAVLGLAVAGGFSRLWGAEGSSAAYRLAPESVLAPDIRRASAEVKEAYRFAIANQDVLRYIPCYCGCGSSGHTSNASCYLKDGSKPGNLIFDRMSLA